MEGSESMSFATLFHLFMTGRSAARQLLRFLRFLLFKFFMEKDGLFRRCLSLTSVRAAILCSIRLCIDCGAGRSRHGPGQDAQATCFIVIQIFEQEATEDDKWRDRRACLWPRFFICS